MTSGRLPACAASIALDFLAIKRPFSLFDLLHRLADPEESGWLCSDSPGGDYAVRMSLPCCVSRNR